MYVPAHVCMHAHIYTSEHVHVCARVEKQDVHVRTCSTTLHPIFCDRVSQLNLKPLDSARLAGHQTPGGFFLKLCIVAHAYNAST